jgi:hypothetical protein
MAEVRICFEVDFEYCEMSLMHGDQFVRARSSTRLWRTLFLVLCPQLVILAAIWVLRVPGLPPLTRGLIVGSLGLPMLSVLVQFFEFQTSVDRNLANLRQPVRDQGWSEQLDSGDCSYSS